MLWNWNTIDACFITTHWHIKTNGMFAGSCIGVILLGMLLECLRRTAKEYDSYLIRKGSMNGFVAPVRTPEAGETGRDSPKVAPEATTGSAHQGLAGGYRPKIYEQAARALLHTAQFVVAYFLMLLVAQRFNLFTFPAQLLLLRLRARLAMYYNGYLIICIFIGTLIGSFIFQWEKLGA